MMLPSSVMDCSAQPLSECGLISSTPAPFRLSANGAIPCTTQFDRSNMQPFDHRHDVRWAVHPAKTNESMRAAAALTGLHVHDSRCSRPGGPKNRHSSGRPVAVTPYIRPVRHKPTTATPKTSLNTRTRAISAYSCGRLPIESASAIHWQALAQSNNPQHVHPRTIRTLPIILTQPGTRKTASSAPRTAPVDFKVARAVLVASPACARSRRRAKSSAGF